MSDDVKKLSLEEKRQKKSAARLYAVQALFQMEAAGQTVDKVRREFETHRFGAVIEGDDGSRLEVGPGDAFVLRPGFSGIWRVLETLRKDYVILYR